MSRKGDPLLQLRRELDSLTSWQILVAVLFLVLFLFSPLVFMMWRAFYREGSITTYYFQSVVQDPDFLKMNPELTLFVIRDTPLGSFIFIGDRGPDFGILLNSVLVSLSVMVLCLIIGTGVAYLVVRYNFLGKTFFRTILLVPLLATPFVNAFVIGKVLGQNGLFNQLLHDTLGILPFSVQITGLPALILIQTISFFPIVYLNAMSSFISIDPSMEEQAQSLGGKGFHVLRTITLPLAMPGITAGAVLVFILSLEDLGAPVGLSGAFGSGIHQRVMNFYIYGEFKRGLGSIEQIHPSTYAIAAIMLLIAVATFIIIRKYVTLRKYAMIAKGSRYSLKVRELGKLGTATVIALLTLLSLVVAFPQLGVLVLAFSDWATNGLPFPTAGTLKYVIDMWTEEEVLRAISNSLIYSASAVVIMLVIGTSIAYIVARKKLKGLEILDAVATLPTAIPGVILAIGYLLFFSVFFSGQPLDPFLFPGLLLVFSYSVRRLPFTTRAVFSGLQQTHESLEEASMNLGADRLTTFKNIVAPLIASNMISGALLSFVYSMNEVSTSITLSSLKPQQGPVTFYMSQIVYAGGSVGAVSIAAALGVLLMGVQLIAMTVSNLVLKQKVAFWGV